MKATDFPDERTRCEIWSRVMGYHRPVSEWNVGKQQEFADRKFFEESAIKFI
jgi:anaerobic ribonucleoside-triphosphate reductase